MGNPSCSAHAATAAWLPSSYCTCLSAAMLRLQPCIRPQLVVLPQAAAKAAEKGHRSTCYRSPALPAPHSESAPAAECHDPALLMSVCALRHHPTSSRCVAGTGICCACNPSNGARQGKSATLDMMAPRQRTPCSKMNSRPYQHNSATWNPTSLESRRTPAQQALMAAREPQALTVVAAPPAGCLMLQRQEAGCSVLATDRWRLPEHAATA